MNEAPLNEPMSSRDRLAISALVVAAAALCIVAASLPALPVDETRYLTVAWEMRATGNWSLPTLNFAPYSHKPPLLFWLINANWSIFGLAVWPARMIGAMAMSVVLVLTHLLDKRLAPHTRSGPAASPVMLLGLPLFVALGFSIMFDMLLTATVSGAMLALWIAGRTGSRVAFAAYAVSIGLGLLAKGPVGLLFTLPVALLGPYWIELAQKRGWYTRIALSLAFGIAIGLAWALRAAYLGGPEFAEMLFWKQSAGRITSSFAHARPIWFYVPILLLLLTPLLLWRPAATALVAALRDRNPARNFLLAWFLPAFIGLSFVSGKQLHYLLPLLPAVTLLISLGLCHVELRSSDRLPLIVFALAIMVALAVYAIGGSRWHVLEGSLSAMAQNISLPILLLTSAVALAAVTSVGNSLRGSLTGIVVANLVVLTSLAAQSRETLAHLFDLQPLAEVVAPLKSRPIAMTQEYRGEFGFLSRLERPVEEVPINRLQCWTVDHPDGIAIVRTRDGAKNASFDPGQWNVLAEKKYRLEETFMVIEAKSRIPGQPTDNTSADLAAACKR